MLSLCNIMVRYCSECKNEGGFFEIKNRDLPLSKTRELCPYCYNKIFSKENAELQKIMESGAVGITTSSKELWTMYA